MEGIVENMVYIPIAVNDGLEVYNLLKRDTNFAMAILDMIKLNIEGLELIRFIKNNEFLKKIQIGLITAEEDRI